MLHDESCEASFAAVEETTLIVQNEENHQAETLQSTMKEETEMAMLRWQQTLERASTVLSLTIATLLYIHLFASAAAYMPVPWAKSDSRTLSSFAIFDFSGQHLRGKNHWRQKSVFNNSEELRFAVTSWLDNKSKTLEQFGHITAWNVSLIDTMDHLFEDAVDFDDDLSQWDVSRVKNMSYMFRGTKAFTGDSLAQWNTSSVQDFSHMFEDSAFRANISAWDVRAGSQFDYMFHNCRQMNSSAVPSIGRPVDAAAPTNALKRLTESHFPSAGEQEGFDDDLQSIETFQDDGIQTTIRISSGGQNASVNVTALSLGFIPYGIILVAVFAFCNRVK